VQEQACSSRSMLAFSQAHKKFGSKKCLYEILTHIKARFMLAQKSQETLFFVDREFYAIDFTFL
jgi:hypothetical protein